MTDFPEKEKDFAAESDEERLLRQLQHSEATLFEQLAAEEPPIDDEDTARSATQPNPVVLNGQNGHGKWQRYLGGILLFAALILGIAAGLIVLMDEDESGDSDTETVQSTQVPEEIAGMPDDVGITPTEIRRPVATEEASAEPPSQTLPPTRQPTQAGNSGSGIAVASINLPTAAVDEQALALMTPVANLADDGNAVVRNNLSITVGSAETIGRELQTYTVKSGDTIKSISELYNLDECSLVWSNERRVVSPLRPGNQLVIPPTDGVLERIMVSKSISEVAEETNVDPYDIIESPYNTVLFGARPDSILPEGTLIMVPDGDGGNCNIWEAKPLAAGATSGAGGTTYTNYSLWGCTVDNLNPGGFPGGHPIPSRSYTFFRGFTPGHPAVDLAGTVGESIAATGAGTVIYAGSVSGGYGNVVVIAHAGATRFSLYAHLNSVNVRCGQEVSPGQTIGTLGNTGNSSGPHLHYEIRDANFNPMDPCFTISC